MVTSNRRKRNWRRVGWGALIGLAVLIITAAIALWLGPPRDPKSFALDDEDFGLGFRVGDPWDPDAFEAAMKANGFPVDRTSNSTEEDEFSFHSEFWRTTDGYLLVDAFSDNKSAIAKLRSIGISCSAPIDLYREARELFPDDDSRRHLHVLEGRINEASKRFPQVHTDEGILIGSGVSQVLSTYGEPLMELPFAPGSPILGYFGDYRSVTFFSSNNKVAAVNIMPGYRNGGIVWRLGIWHAYITTPFFVRWMEREAARYEAEQGESETDSPSTVMESKG